MQCVCTNDCYTNHEGGYRHYYMHEIHNFKECPPRHFKPLGEWTVDFENDPAEVLLKSREWSGTEAQEWLMQKYSKHVDMPISKDKLVALIVDTRERSIQVLKPDGEE